MANSELFDLNGGVGLDSTELDATMGIYLVDPANGSRFVTLDELKTWINTDPTIVPSSEPWRGCRAYRTSDATSVASGAEIAWQAAAIDTDSIWSGGAPTRLTVPTGVTKIRLRWGVQMEALATAGQLISRVLKNTSGLSLSESCTLIAPRQSNTGFTNNYSGGYSGVLSVTAGDYFELEVVFSMTSQDQVLATNATYFELEIVEG